MWSGAKRTYKADTVGWLSQGGAADLQPCVTSAAPVVEERPRNYCSCFYCYPTSLTNFSSFAPTTSGCAPRQTCVGLAFLTPCLTADN